VPVVRVTVHVVPVNALQAKQKPWPSEKFPALGYSVTPWVGHSAQKARSSLGMIRSPFLCLVYPGC